MRALLSVTVALALLATGCTTDPEEATGNVTGDVEEPDSESTPPAAEPTDGLPVTDVTMVAGTPTGPAPAVPTPVPAVTAPAPTPEPLAPAPPTPEPTAPAPTPAPSPSPAPTPTPTPTPTLSPTPTPSAWPREGSHVTVRGSASDSVPNTFVNASEWIATWTYTNGDWRGSCEGTWSHDWDESMTQYGYEDMTGTFSRTFAPSNPPHWPLFNTRSPPAQGQQVEAWVMWDCQLSSASMLYSGTQTIEGWGLVHNVDDTQEAEENYSDFDGYWDPETGLVLSWSWARLHSGTSGSVVATDAPV